jgi:hypothetical protein
VRYETVGREDATTNLYATAVRRSVKVIPSRSAVPREVPSSLRKHESGLRRVKIQIGRITLEI